VLGLDGVERRVDLRGVGDVAADAEQTRRRLAGAVGDGDLVALRGRCRDGPR
jgi:hypothetical protein